jgi:hypothetical protein
VRTATSSRIAAVDITNSWPNHQLPDKRFNSLEMRVSS